MPQQIAADRRRRVRYRARRPREGRAQSALMGERRSYATCGVALCGATSSDRRARVDRERPASTNRQSRDDFSPPPTGPKIFPVAWTGLAEAADLCSEASER